MVLKSYLDGFLQAAAAQGEIQHLPIQLPVILYPFTLDPGKCF